MRDEELVMVVNELCWPSTSLAGERPRLGAEPAQIPAADRPISRAVMTTGDIRRQRRRCPVSCWPLPRVRCSPAQSLPVGAQPLSAPARPLTACRFRWAGRHPEAPGDAQRCPEPTRET